jgi:hypothetical protein
MLLIVTNPEIREALEKPFECHDLPMPVCRPGRHRR